MNWIRSLRLSDDDDDGGDDEPNKQYEILLTWLTWPGRMSIVVVAVCWLDAGRRQEDIELKCFARNAACDCHDHLRVSAHLAAGLSSLIELNNNNNDDGIHSFD